MENICGVTQHLRAKIQAEGGDPGRECLNVIPTLSGAAYYIDSEGNAVDNVDRSITINRMSKEQLAGLNDVNQISYDITIPNQPSDYLITEVTKPYDYSDATRKRVRPDIYI